MPVTPKPWTFNIIQPKIKTEHTIVIYLENNVMF